MSDIWQSLTVIALAIVGVATLAVIVSKNANTVGVVNATGAAFSNSLAVAISPVTGAVTGGASSISSNFPIY